MKKDRNMEYFLAGIFMGIILGVLAIACAYRIGKESEEALKNAVIVVCLIDFTPVSLILVHEICCDVMKLAKKIRQRQKKNGDDNLCS